MKVALEMTSWILLSSEGALERSVPKLIPLPFISSKIDEEGSVIIHSFIFLTPFNQIYELHCMVMSKFYLCNLKLIKVGKLIKSLSFMYSKFSINQ